MQPDGYKLPPVSIRSRDLHTSLLCLDSWLLNGGLTFDRMYSYPVQRGLVEVAAAQVSPGDRK